MKVDRFEHTVYKKCWCLPHNFCQVVRQSSKGEAEAVDFIQICAFLTGAKLGYMHEPELLIVCAGYGSV